MVPATWLKLNKFSSFTSFVLILYDIAMLCFCHQGKLASCFVFVRESFQLYWAFLLSIFMVFLLILYDADEDVKSNSYSEG